MPRPSALAIWTMESSLSSLAIMKIKHQRACDKPAVESFMCSLILSPIYRDHGVRRNRLLFIDPLMEPNKDIQMRPHNIVRELDRIYCALYEDMEDQPANTAGTATATAATAAAPTVGKGTPQKPGEKQKRKKEAGLEIKPKQPAFVVATDDWGCDAHFGGDPFIKVCFLHYISCNCLTNFHGHY